MKIVFLITLAYLNYVKLESILAPAKLPNVDITSSLYTLSIEMNNNQIMDFIIDNAFNKSKYIYNNYGISPPKIELLTVLQMLKSEHLPSFDDALDDLEITYANFKNAFIGYRPTYNLLQLLGISFSEIIDNFLKHIKYDNVTFLKILQLINIDPGKFQQTLWYNNEESYFNMFANGSYEEDNLKKVIKISNIEVNFSNLVKIINFGTDFIEKFSIHIDDNFIDIMKNLKVDSGNLQAALKNFDILMSKEPSNIGPMPAILEDLKKQKSIATQISEYKVVTHKNAETLRKFKELAPSATLFGMNMADDRKIEFILNTINPIPENYAALWTQDSMGLIFVALETIEEIQNQTDYTNCVYWYMDNNVISPVETTPIVANNAFIVKKSKLQHILVDGTPLFCNDKLYALSIQDTPAKKNAIFMSKYPIIKKQEYEENHNIELYPTTATMLINVFNNIKELIITSYNILKLLLGYNYVTQDK